MRCIGFIDVVNGERDFKHLFIAHISQRRQFIRTYETCMSLNVDTLSMLL